MLLRQRDNKGFTLVEVLVVVVILAILAAIAVPIYLHYVESARAGEAQEAIGSILAAAKVYHAQTGNWPTDIRLLEDRNMLNLDQVVKDRWHFTITPGADGIRTILATSTGLMPGGAAKQVRYNGTNGSWTGYGNGD
jgi:prepilin-type N-terminal cleavage/methylation domain-containing protein